jgi:hypothetical protein
LKALFLLAIIDNYIFEYTYRFVFHGDSNIFSSSGSKDTKSTVSLQTNRHDLAYSLFDFQLYHSCPVPISSAVK